MLGKKHGNNPHNFSNSNENKKRKKNNISNLKSINPFQYIIFLYYSEDVVNETPTNFRFSQKEEKHPKNTNCCLSDELEHNYIFSNNPEIVKDSLKQTIQKLHKEKNKNLEKTKENNEYNLSNIKLAGSEIGKSIFEYLKFKENETFRNVDNLLNISYSFSCNDNYIIPFPSKLSDDKKLIIFEINNQKIFSNIQNFFKKKREMDLSQKQNKKEEMVESSESINMFSSEEDTNEKEKNNKGEAKINLNFGSDDDGIAKQINSYKDVNLSKLLNN